MVLGDVANSMVLHHDLAYIVVNNSQKIEIAKANDFKHTTTISGFASPRYMLPLGNGKALATNLVSNIINEIDLAPKQLPKRLKYLVMAILVGLNN